VTSRVPVGLPQPQGVGEDPLGQYSRIFTRFLQLVFASFPKGSYMWSEDPLNTDLTIQGEGTVATEVVEKRPAIIVARGAVSFTNVAIDQFAGPLLDPKTGKVTYNLDPNTGARRHTDLLSSVMTFNCLSSEDLEAQRIAWTCAFAVRALKRALMKTGIHRVGEDIQVSPASGPGAIVQPDAGEIVMVSVTIPFFFQQTWTVSPIDKSLLNGVAMALRSEAGYPESPPPVLRGPGLNGQPLEYDRLVSITQGSETMKTGSGTP
jgi:hypothetical protein